MKYNDHPLEQDFRRWQEENRPAPQTAPEKPPRPEPDDPLEAAFWAFDAARKAGGERLAFKDAVRSLVAAPLPVVQPARDAATARAEKAGRVPEDVLKREERAIERAEQAEADTRRAEAEVADRDGKIDRLACALRAALARVRGLEGAARRVCAIEPSGNLGTLWLAVAALRSALATPSTPAPAAEPPPMEPYEQCARFIEEQAARYPADIFPADSKTPDAIAAKMARHLCRVLAEQVRGLAAAPPSAPPAQEQGRDLGDLPAVAQRVCDEIAKLPPMQGWFGPLAYEAARLRARLSALTAPSAPPEGDAAEHYLTIGTMYTVYTGGHIPTPHHDGVWPMTIERVDEDVAVPPEGHGDET